MMGSRLLSKPGRVADDNDGDDEEVGFPRLVCRKPRSWASRLPIFCLQAAFTHTDEDGRDAGAGNRDTVTEALLSELTALSSD